MTPAENPHQTLKRIINIIEAKGRATRAQIFTMREAADHLETAATIHVRTREMLENQRDQQTARADRQEKKAQEYREKEEFSAIAVQAGREALEGAAREIREMQDEILENRRALIENCKKCASVLDAANARTAALRIEFLELTDAHARTRAEFSENVAHLRAMQDMHRDAVRERQQLERELESVENAAHGALESLEFYAGISNQSPDDGPKYYEQRAAMIKNELSARRARAASELAAFRDTASQDTERLRDARKYISELQEEIINHQEECSKSDERAMNAARRLEDLEQVIITYAEIAGLARPARPEAADTVRALGEAVRDWKQAEHRNALAIAAARRALAGNDVRGLKSASLALDALENLKGN